MNFVKSTWCLHNILALRIRELNHHQIPHITLRTGRNCFFFAKIAEVQFFLNYAMHSHCCVASSSPKQQNIPNPSKETTKDSENQSITIIIVYMYMISFVYICVYHCISHISEHVLHYISMLLVHQKAPPKAPLFRCGGDPPGSPSQRCSAPRKSRFEAARPGCAKRWLNMAELFDEMEVEIPHSKRFQ